MRRGPALTATAVAHPVKSAAGSLRPPSANPRSAVRRRLQDFPLPAPFTPTVAAMVAVTGGPAEALVAVEAVGARRSEGEAAAAAAAWALGGALVRAGTEVPALEAAGSGGGLAQPHLLRVPPRPPPAHSTVTTAARRVTLPAAAPIGDGNTQARTQCGSHRVQVCVRAHPLVILL